jgi:N6-adenosine-specific RNA methylase IME4
MPRSASVVCLPASSPCAPRIAGAASPAASRPWRARATTIGLGYWNRSVHEILLIGTRGKIPCPALGTQWESVIDADRGEHSAKPEIFHEMIEEYFPTLPKIELNRRGKPRSGWSAWGNEVRNEK